MPHEVWNLGNQDADARLQPRQFIAGIEPAREIVLGRSRRRKKMLVLLNAWLEPVGISAAGSGATDSMKYSLALGKDPLNTALLIPVGMVLVSGDGTNDNNINVVPLFNAHGWMGAVKQVAIDVDESGGVSVDMDLHLEWTVAEVDWWTWFVSWNNLEASPDGNLVDGDRAYS